MDPAAKRAKIDEDAEVDEGDEVDVGDEAPDDEMVRVVASLSEVQEELEKIQDELSDAVLAVEQKYNEIRRPVYSRRNEHISKIPDFWLQCFVNHHFLSDYLTEEDQNVFAHLYELDVLDNEDLHSGYKIVFTFHENPFFTNEVLQKEYKFAEDGTLSVESTPIDWKEGMDITQDVNDGKKRGREPSSFFLWFTDSEENPQFRQQNYEIASNIKDDLWPDPLKYYLTQEEGNEEDDLGEDELDPDDDLGDEEEEGDEEEDDEELAEGEDEMGDEDLDGEDDEGFEDEEQYDEGDGEGEGEGEEEFEEEEDEEGLEGEGEEGFEEED